MKKSKVKFQIMKNAMEKVLVTWVCGIALLPAREILFRTLIWDDVTKIWDENLLFTFLTGKLRKNLFWTKKKFVYLNIITNFRDIVPN